MTARIESLQALRFVAAAMVALLHIQQGANAIAGRPLTGGWIQEGGSFGIDLFFVLSGYIITATAPGLSPREFLRRRVIRVVPAYWLATLAFAPLALAAAPLDPWRALASLTFYPGFGLPLLAVGWTLSFEMLFYVVAAAVLVRPRVLLPAALLLYALCFAARLELGGVFRVLGNPLVLEFLVGAALTRVTLRTPAVASVAAAVGMIGAGWAIASGLHGANNVYGLIAGETALARVVALGIPAALIVFATLALPLRPSALTWLGDASYALYLVHPHVIAALALALADAALMPWQFVTIATALAIAAAAIAHRWIEQPMLTALRRRTRSAPPPAITPGRRRSAAHSAAAPSA